MLYPGQGHSRSGVHMVTQHQTPSVTLLNSKERAKELFLSRPSLGECTLTSPADLGQLFTTPHRATDRRWGRGRRNSVILLRAIGTQNVSDDEYECVRFLREGSLPECLEDAS